MDGQQPIGNGNERQRRRGIYLLPNLFTTGTLFAGFFAIMSSIDGNHLHSVIAIFLGMLSDALDGRVARLTNTQSDFGKEYDSLADMVAFGLAPALVMYQWSLHELAEYGRFGRQLAWVVPFFYAAMTALRLARFNVIEPDKVEPGYFFGLPSPSAAAMTMGYVWVMLDFGFTGGSLVIVSLVVTLGAGALMVADMIRYPTFKEINFAEHVPFTYILVMVLVCLLVWFDPPRVLFAVFMVYIVWGPVAYLRDRVKGKR
ncbi:MAG: CDP-diacylglycerol--serine O-phosphatidyltransferase [Salinisphaeraceae bacterium]|nr:CDP-diacylglycerol--serine O-phosphatidyltransferase [Salinisphaeraceae bacterium]